MNEQLSMKLDSFGVGAGPKEIDNNLRLLTRDVFNYEFSFLKTIVLKNYGSLHTLVPDNFNEECSKYPYKTSLKHYLSSIDQIKRSEKFGGHDMRCKVQELSFPEIVSARNVSLQWCESEIRPFEVMINGLFEYGMLIGLKRESMTLP
jgi:hypothetical protein